MIDVITLDMCEPKRKTVNITAGAEETITLEDGTDYVIDQARELTIIPPPGEYKCHLIIRMSDTDDDMDIYSGGVQLSGDDISQARRSETWEISAVGGQSLAINTHLWIAINWGVFI